MNNTRLDPRELNAAEIAAVAGGFSLHFSFHLARPERRMRHATAYHATVVIGQGNGEGNGEGNGVSSGNGEGNGQGNIITD